LPQAERHAVDGALPLDAGPSMLSALSEPELRRAPQTVFRKKRHESTLSSPAQTYYTIKTSASDAEMGSMDGSSGFGGGSSMMSAPGGSRRSGSIANGRRSAGLARSQESMPELTGSLPREHVERLEKQRGDIAEQRERSRRMFEEKRVRHYMTQPLVELYGGCMVVLKVS
jgi:hypothetical protein